MHHDLYDPPSCGGTPAQEGMEEQRQIFGAENPSQEWILTGWDVWVKNPYYHGPAGMHPEDDPEAYEANKNWVPPIVKHQEDCLDDCPF